MKKIKKLGLILVVAMGKSAFASSVYSGTCNIHQYNFYKSSSVTRPFNLELKEGSSPVTLEFNEPVTGNAYKGIKVSIDFRQDETGKKSVRYDFSWTTLGPYLSSGGSASTHLKDVEPGKALHFHQNIQKVFGKVGDPVSNFRNLVFNCSGVVNE